VPVNTFTTGYQAETAVGMSAAGAFVVAWMSEGQDGSNGGIYAQRYSAAGLPSGSEFRVNTYTTSTQRFPAVAVDADGDFVVAWGSFPGQDGDLEGVYAQRYADLDDNGDTAAPAVTAVIPAGAAAPVRPNDRLAAP